MTREEAKEHFWRTSGFMLCKQTLDQVDQYYRQHKEELAKEFAQTMITFCLTVRKLQESGKKGKIRYLCCSLLYSALLKEQPMWRLDAYDENFYEDEQECAQGFDTPWLFTPLHETCRQLEEGRKKYVGKISPVDIDIIKRQQAFFYLHYALLVARQGMLQVVDSAEFQAMDKEEQVDIGVGEFHDLTEKVYCYDVCPKESREIKKWLEKKLGDDYFASVLTDLDLSHGDYVDIELSYARMNRSLLRWVNVSGALLDGTNLSQCTIEDSNFSFCQISGALFDGAIIKGTSFQESNGAPRNTYTDEGTEQEMAIQILSGVSFRHSQIADSDLSLAYLDKADFSSATLRNVSFQYSSLVEADFTDAVLTHCDFRGAEMSPVQFKNATLNNCQFDEEELEEKNETLLAKPREAERGILYSYSR